MGLRIVFSGFLLFVVKLSFSAIFVATNGNNSTGNGTIALPFKTIQKACTAVKAGDTILIRGGTYNQRDYIDTGPDGTQAKPIVVRNYKGETVIFDGTGVALGNNEALITIARWTSQPWMRHFVLQGITVRNSSQRGISYYKTENLRIFNCRVYNIQKRCIGGYGHSTTIETNEVFNGSLINQNGALGSSGWPIQIHGTADWETGAGSTNLTIRNNVVYNSWGEGISPGMGSTIVLIEGNTVHDVWSVGIYCDRASGVIVRNNHVYNVNSMYFRGGHPAKGVGFSNETSFEGTYPAVKDLHIYNNLLSNNRRGISFWYDASNSDKKNSYSNVVIAYNVVYNPTQYALYIDEVPAVNQAPSGCVLKNNVLYKGSFQAYVGNFSAWSVSHNNWVGGIPSFGNVASFNSDPIFVNPGISSSPSGFMLSSSGSPCYAKATPLPAVTTLDYFGNSRSSTAPSIGIHEYRVVTALDDRKPRPHNETIRHILSGSKLATIVNSEYQGRVKIRLFSITGSEMINCSGFKSLGEWRNETDVSGLGPGIYIVDVTLGNRHYAEKLRINN